MEGQESSRSNESFFWNLYGRCYDGINHAIPYRGLLYDLYTSLDLQPGQRILNAGCGTANFEVFISTRDIPPIQIEAVDFSPVMLDRAKKKCDGLDFVSFNLLDLNKKLDFPDSVFDRILCSNVLYALDDPSFTLGEMLRVMKPDGKLVISNPRPSAKIGPLVKDHFIRIGNIWGILQKARVFARTLVTLPIAGLAPIMLNVFVIEVRSKKNEYHFLQKQQLIQLFTQRNSKIISIIPTYADQNWLAVATGYSEAA